jgi:hypothetical protein
MRVQETVRWDMNVAFGIACDTIRIIRSGAALSIPFAS